ncbi:unnamed protein product, partial [Gulo gulo]
GSQRFPGGRARGAVGARVFAQWDAGERASVPRDARESLPVDEGAAACVGAARGLRSLLCLCLGFIKVVKLLNSSPRSYVPNR